MTALAAFCVATAIFLVPRDLFFSDTRDVANPRQSARYPIRLRPQRCAPHQLRRFAHRVVCHFSAHRQAALR